MTDDKAASRPPIHMIEAEADNLASLAASVEDRMPQVSELLLEEIARHIGLTFHQPFPRLLPCNCRTVLRKTAPRPSLTQTLSTEFSKPLYSGRCEM